MNLPLRDLGLELVPGMLISVLTLLVSNLSSKLDCLTDGPARHIAVPNKDGCVGEQIVHVFEGQLASLREEGPEHGCVGEVGHDEENVEVPCRIRHADGSDLADHSVERVRCHGSERHTFGTRCGVEDLGGDQPRLRPQVLAFTNLDDHRDDNLQSEPMLEKVKLKHQVMMMNPQ